MDETKPGPKPISPKARLAWQRVRRNFVRGNVKDLAKHLGVKPPAVSKWPYVPEARLDDVAEFLGVEPRELRPDLFPPWAGL